MVSRSIIASAAIAALAAACTRAPSSAPTPGGSVAAVQPAAPPNPVTHPGVTVPDSRTPQPASDTAPPGPPSTTPAATVGTAATGSAQRVDSARVAALEHEAVALAKTTGCSSDDQCRNAPVGVKACGGPRYYLKYCAVSTDTVALFHALARLDTAERAYNKKYHIVSTCQMILPTRPHIVGGVCR